jgi:hypothetical protein
MISTFWSFKMESRIKLMGAFKSSGDWTYNLSSRVTVIGHIATGLEDGIAIVWIPVV